MPRVSSNPKSFLKGLKAAWNVQKKQAIEDGPSGILPDAKYNARIVSVKLDQGNKGWQLIWQFKVVQGPYAGKKITRWDGLEGEQSLYYIAKQLMIFGMDIDDFDIEQLPDIAEQLTEAQPYVSITVRTTANSAGKEYTNVYLNQHFEEDIEDETESESDSDSDEEEEDDETEDNGDESEDEESEDDEEDDDSDENEDDEDGEEESDEDEDDLDIQIGMRCDYVKAGKSGTGEIVAMDEDAGTVTVKDDESGKKKTVSVDDIEILDDEESDEEEDDTDEDEEEEEEAPAPKKRGRPAGSTNKPKPAAKPAPAPAKAPVKKPAAAPAKLSSNKIGKFGKKK